MQYLIDGHNLIGKMPTLRLDDPHDEAKLLEYLRSYRAKTGHHLTVIFDAGQGYQGGRSKSGGGITVTFARSGQTADQLIMQRLRKVKNPQATMVVTSDREIQRVAKNTRVRVVDAYIFSQQLLTGSASSSKGKTSTLDDEPDEGKQANINLSADEVDEWLRLFKAKD